LDNGCCAEYRIIWLESPLEVVTINAANILSISFWRGVWLLQDVFLIPGNREFSYWISHVTGYLGLTLLLTSRSFTGFDCIMDTDIAEESDVIYDITYIQRILSFLNCTLPKTSLVADNDLQDKYHFEQSEPLRSK